MPTATERAPLNRRHCSKLLEMAALMLAACLQRKEMPRWAYVIVQVGQLFDQAIIQVAGGTDSYNLNDDRGVRTGAEAVVKYLRDRGCGQTCLMGLSIKLLLDLPICRWTQNNKVSRGRKFISNLLPNAQYLSSTCFGYTTWYSSVSYSI